MVNSRKIAEISTKLCLPCHLSYALLICIQLVVTAWIWWPSNLLACHWSQPADSSCHDCSLVYVTFELKVRFSFLVLVNSVTCVVNCESLTPALAWDHLQFLLWLFLYDSTPRWYQLPSGMFARLLGRLQIDYEAHNLWWLGWAARTTLTVWSQIFVVWFRWVYGWDLMRNWQMCSVISYIDLIPSTTQQTDLVQTLGPSSVLYRQRSHTFVAKVFYGAKQDFSIFSSFFFPSFLV